MDTKFKEGDEVYYKPSASGPEPRKKFRVRKVEPVQVTEEVKNTVDQQQTPALYGKEIEKMREPGLFFIIEPLSGGESIKVNQAEIELALDT